MRNLIFIWTILVISFHTGSYAQQPSVRNPAGSQYCWPWTGGFDACQFGEIDLDEDNKMDLLVFDRRGNRLSAFLNRGEINEINFEFAPQLTGLFPELFEWAVFIDYDFDGLTDIFTYSPGWAGIRVFRNQGGSPPQFKLVVYPYLTSFQGGGYVNILATNADYPAIYDVDGDGDLDMLNFWALGTFIELHLNQSIEKYGHADSLDFVKSDFCWGRVAENEENNLLYLDSCLFDKPAIAAIDGNRHRGATMLMEDFDANGLPDLLLADVDYPGLTLLKNGGSVQTAVIVEQDTAFPSGDVPVHLFSMPVANFADVNNDGLHDLLVSPFDPNPEVSENSQSIWLYLREPVVGPASYRLETKSFLQEQSIDLGSGAYPVVVDLDQDGHTDLVCGNYGKYIRSWYTANTLHSEYKSGIHFFRTIFREGVRQLEIVNQDLAGLSSLGLLGLFPAFSDLNSDGFMDMLVGNELGTLFYVTQNEDHNWNLITTAFQDIDVGEWSTPQLFDVDEDGVTDLLIGSKNGKISYYKGRIFNGFIEFDFVTDFFGGVNVTDFSLSYDGFSVPCFFTDKQGQIRLVTGSEQGKLFLFDQISDNLTGNFREVNDWQLIIGTQHQQIDPGMRSAAGVGNLLDNEALQLIVGNFSGGLNLMNADLAVSPGQVEHLDSSLQLSPNPFQEKVEITWGADLPELLNLALIDFQGRVVEETTIRQGTLNLGHLVRGIYLMKVSSQGKYVTRKMIKI